MTTRWLKTTARNLILYIDKGVIVVSKPPGITSQARARPSQSAKHIRNNRDSLDGILDDITRTLRLESRPLSVHRLDKRTTGALLLTRTPSAARDLSRQFRSRIIGKTYLALVRAGRETFDAAATTSGGQIDAALTIADGRVSISDESKSADNAGGEDLGKGAQDFHFHHALTGWELVASSAHNSVGIIRTSDTLAPVSLLRLTLHTGFKHQLRVHLASVLKAPILGDTLYSRSALSEKIQHVVTVPENRLFLHASHISFYRYRNVAPKRLHVGVTAPLPEDFAQLCGRLGLELEEREVMGGVVINGETAPWDMRDYEGWRWGGEAGAEVEWPDGSRDSADSSSDMVQQQ